MFEWPSLRPLGIKMGYWMDVNRQEKVILILAVSSLLVVNVGFAILYFGQHFASVAAPAQRTYVQMLNEFYDVTLLLIPLNQPHGMEGYGPKAKTLVFGSRRHCNEGDCGIVAWAPSAWENITQIPKGISWGSWSVFWTNVRVPFTFFKDGTIAYREDTDVSCQVWRESSGSYYPTGETAPCSSPGDEGAPNPGQFCRIPPTLDMCNTSFFRTVHMPGEPWGSSLPCDVGFPSVMLMMPFMTGSASPASSGLEDCIYGYGQPGGDDPGYSIDFDYSLLRQKFPKSVTWRNNSGMRISSTRTIDTRTGTSNVELLAQLDPGLEPSTITVDLAEKVTELYVSYTLSMAFASWSAMFGYTLTAFTILFSKSSHAPLHFAFGNTAKKYTWKPPAEHLEDTEAPPVGATLTREEHGLSLQTPDRSRSSLLQ
eukprot:TRINITY_DN40073_c0_g1_i1.p1 TRINITY_DN40073_c0_g1~~TRINITY_DN40073_c0_g1_i1.p1  ORF type:complete len:426 (+),score=24.18 TRINITY_DN40073_c0_g1_i1:46-1323(+)